jgi:large subunit ribosomal protein L9
MKVVLLQRVEKLGLMGEIVDVKTGYARNYLIPTKKALRASKENIAFFESQSNVLESQNIETKKEATTIANKIENSFYVMVRQAGDSGQLYGSVTSRDISVILSDIGIAIKRNQVQLLNPIKILGIHDVKIMLHPEVSIIIKINVARTEEEAVRQEKGEDVSRQSQEQEINEIDKNIFDEGVDIPLTSDDLDHDNLIEDTAKEETLSKNKDLDSLDKDGL